MKNPLPNLPILIAILATFGVSCSKEDSQSSTATPPSNSTPATDESKKIRLYSWGEYFDESLIAQFTEETGIEVDYQPYESADEMRELIKSNPGKYDVVIMDDLALQRMERTRVIRELDQSLLTNLHHLDTRHLPKDHEKGLHSIPYFWGTTLVAYNKKHIQEPEESWGILFDPDLKGKVSLIDDRMECSVNMMRYLGHAADTEEPTEIRAASERLLNLVNSQKAIFDSDVAANENILNESVWAGMIYSVDLAQALQENPEDIGYFHPKEGTTIYVDNFTIPRDSLNWKEAHRFINFMMDPKVAAQSSFYVRAATANRSAQEHLAKMDPELLKSVAYAGDAERVGVLIEGSQERQKIIHEGWQAVEKALYDRDGAGPVTSAEVTDE